MKLCSACLLGKNCKYDGGNNRNEKVMKLAENEEFLAICPEELGGLETPREAAEIQSNETVITKSKKDITRNFFLGAEAILKIAQEKNITQAILKQKSPSCGCGKIHDGTFSGKIINGDGITTKLLKRNGISVISEEDL
ncbi:MAG: DUF523 domain-containing protein [bacterium]